jgi:nucleotide-binding universal stress UspA family protein
MAHALDRILVGVDFDAASASAVAVGGALAKATGAGLFVMHAEAVDAPAYFTAAEEAAIVAERAQARATAASAVGAFVAAHTEVHGEALVQDGPAAEALLRIAPSFDLVVVGTHRARGARRWWLGSVAESVVRRTPVPVLVVPAGDGASVLASGAAVVVAGQVNDTVQGWVAMLRQALGLRIVHRESIAACDVRLVIDAALLVVAVSADGDRGPEFDAIVHILKECPHLVLFVPARASAQGG